MIHIGIDFDNTIVCYDAVFYRVALEKELIPPELSPNKTHIRDYFRSQGKEDLWTTLQGTVYGDRMDLATPFPGIDQFIHLSKERSCKISIISHKTKYPYLGPKHDLHASAEQWLLKQPFFHSEISYFFELTLSEKFQKIEKERCDYFIDDLPELFNDPRFPIRTKKILFDPSGIHPENPNWEKISTWNQLTSILGF